MDGAPLLAAAAHIALETSVACVNHAQSIGRTTRDGCHRVHPDRLSGDSRSRPRGGPIAGTVITFAGAKDPGPACGSWSSAPSGHALHTGRGVIRWSWPVDRAFPGIGGDRERFGIKRGRATATETSPVCTRKPPKMSAAQRKTVAERMTKYGPNAGSSRRRSSFPLRSPKSGHVHKIGW